MTSHERGEEFLLFVTGNEARLRHNLKKNITYDGSIFDDVFGETVLRVYDAIVKRDVEVEDYEKYFFMASRFQYINEDNRERNRGERHVSLADLKRDIAEESGGTDSFPVDIRRLRRELEEEFGEKDSALFMDYFGYKAEGKASYRKYAKLENMSAGAVGEIVGKIKKYVRKRYGVDKKAEKKAQSGRPEQAEENGGLQQRAMEKALETEEEGKSVVRGVPDEGEGGSCAGHSPSDKFYRGRLGGRERHARLRLREPYICVRQLPQQLASWVAERVPVKGRDFE